MARSIYSDVLWKRGHEAYETSFWTSVSRDDVILQFGGSGNCLKVWRFSWRLESTNFQAWSQNRRYLTCKKHFLILDVNNKLSIFRLLSHHYSHALFYLRLSTDFITFTVVGGVSDSLVLWPSDCFALKTLGEAVSAQLAALLLVSGELCWRSPRDERRQRQQRAGAHRRAWHGSAAGGGGRDLWRWSCGGVSLQSEPPPCLHLLHPSLLQLTLSICSDAAQYSCAAAALSILPPSAEHSRSEPLQLCDPTVTWPDQVDTFDPEDLFLQLIFCECWLGTFCELRCLIRQSWRSLRCRLRCFRQISHLDSEENRMDFTYFWLLATTLMLIHQHQGKPASTCVLALQGWELLQPEHSSDLSFCTACWHCVSDHDL